MNLFYIISFFLFLRPAYADKNTLPVFMIDQDQTMLHISLDPNPFDKMSTSKFANIIHESVKHSSGIIIFVEEYFSIEDISLKDKEGSPYVNLRRSIQDNKSKYFPAVIEPYKLLSQLFPAHKYNVFYLKSRTKLELMDSFKYLYIYFQDGLNETRANVLRRHDLIIREVCFVVSQLKHAPVIAFYTGKTNPVKTEKLHFVPIKPIPIPKDLGVMVVSSGGLFRFSDVFAATPNRRSMFFNQLPMIAEETWSRQSMSTKMAYTDFELEFNFSFLKDRWLLDNVALLEAGEEVGRTIMGVGAPWNMSYVCGEPLIIVNSRDGSAVTISRYQIQPRRRHSRRHDDDVAEDPKPTPAHQGPAWHGDGGGNDGGGDDGGGGDGGGGDGGGGDGGGGDGGGGDGGGGDGGGGDGGGGGDAEPPSFDKSLNCGPYFSAPIVSTLMVTFICLLILSYGIVSMMAIRSNDRYEDPMSKPLVHPEN